MTEGFYRGGDLWSETLERAQLRLDRGRLSEHMIQELGDAATGVVRPASNERLAASLHQSPVGGMGRLVSGKVVWSAPYTGWHRVVLDGLGDRPACRLRSTSPLPFNIRDSAPFSPGTMVLCWVSDQLNHVQIVGALPGLVTDGDRHWPDWISQGSNGGFRRERYHRDFPRLFARDGGQIDFSNGAPPDASSLDWTLLDDLGGGLHLDPLMKFLRTDELCGLWLFYIDRLARLAGHNLDIVSSSHELSIRGDEGEHRIYQGQALYPWEALGCWARTSDVYRSMDDDAVHYSLPYGKHEPAFDDQQPYYRTEEWGGYLGQGSRRSVSLPPELGDEPGNARFSVKQPRRGVFSEQVGSDGHWAVQTAHSWSIAKRLLQPVPQQIRPPEDPTGDDRRRTGGNRYRFSGIELPDGDGGVEHKIQDRPTADGSKPHLRAAAGVRDVAAHTFNWKGVHPFHYHERDFELPEESEIDGSARLQRPWDYGRLRSQQWLDAPPTRSWNVDHRYGDVEYYETTSGIFGLADGSVVIRDGYGAEIRMSGGSIQISAPGDVWLQPGRNLNTLAGDDINLKANNSVDIHANQHDVRIKAQKHIDMLSGNGGETGRILLDCQAAAPVDKVEYLEGEDVGQSGVLLKSAKAGVALLGGDIYLRTGGGGATAGQILLDANKGESPIRALCSSVLVFAQNGLSVATSSEEEDEAQAHHLGPNVVQLATPLVVGGGVSIVKDGLQLRGNLVGIECLMASDRNDSGLLGVHKPGDRSWNATDGSLKSAAESETATATTLSKDRRTSIADLWHEEGKRGHDKTLRNTQYAPRNERQLGTQDFSLPETYYQQLAAGMSVWTEKVIKYQGEEHLGFPGKKAWRERQSFLRVDDALWNERGLDQDRGDAYTEPTLSDWRTAKLDGVYPVK